MCERGGECVWEGGVMFSFYKKTDLDFVADEVLVS